MTRAPQEAPMHAPIETNHRPGTARRRLARPATAGVLLALVAALASGVAAEVRVQDIAELQGRHANRLFGYGLVVGLDGSGDGARSPATLRALMQLHSNYHVPVFDIEELAQNGNVAIVAVEATIPEYGARAGQRIDLTVSAIGPAASLAGGQLLTTPLQEATLALDTILALGGGKIEIAAGENATRGTIRRGAVLEEDFFYNFIEDGALTLVLHENKASFTWARMLARSINIEQQSFARGGDNRGRQVVAGEPLAMAISPTSVRVTIPPYYLDRPAQFISSIMSTMLIEVPEQQARVVINRRTNGISFTGSVSISPTILQIPGLGTVAVGQPGQQPRTVAGVDPENNGGVEFQQLLSTLAQLQLSREQLVAAVEQLHQTGTLHAQLIYTE